MDKSKPPQFNMSNKDLKRHQLNLQDENTISTDVVIKDIYRRKEEEEALELAKKFSLPYLNLSNYQPEAGIVDIIPKELVEKNRIFAFKKEGTNVYLAISNLHNIKTATGLEVLQAQDEYTFIPVLVSESSMKYLISIYDTFAPKIRVEDSIKISKDDQKAAEKIIQEWRTSKNAIKNVPTSKLFEVILASSTSMEASDIHIEPTKDFTHLRFRIDGVLQDVIDLPIASLKSLISRIKILSKLKLNITASSQDGRFSFNAETTNYDARVSILPTAYGESAVLRLLPQEGKFISLDQLGLVGNNAKIIDSIIKQPNGLILNTGPTGSGKTTTLYAILDKINTPDKKIITIEDPIEYRLKGITQSQVSADKEYTFATGLRSILRQDPDVVLVGEIRDEETAAITINASLTGHLVLSTLHTNDAAGAIPRLADLGSKPEYFLEAILAIIAQRLLRKVCPKCAEEYAPDEKTLSLINKELGNLPKNIKQPTLPKSLKRINSEKSLKCTFCNGTGYKGRIGIFEILQPNNEIIKAVLAGTTIGEIKKLAITNGMVTLKQDGILKVLEGLTTLEELDRITKKE